MKRKLVKQGTATLTVSLPSVWIDKHHLRSGAEVDVEEQQESLVISAQRVSREKKIEINTKTFGLFTKNDLSHYYMLGFDEIRIVYDDSQTLANVKDRIAELIGFEIVDQTEKSVTVRAIVSELDDQFDVILSKVFYQLKQMGHDVHEALSQQEYNRLLGIREMEAINNKFVSFLQRLLSKQGYKVYDRTMQAYDMLQNLERVADEYKYMCDSFGQRKKPLEKKTLDALREITEYFSLLHKLYQKYDSVLRGDIYKKRKPLREKIMAMMQEQKDPLIEAHLVSLLDKIYNTGGSLFALLK